MRRRYAHTVLAAAAGSYFAIRFAQVVISPLVPAVIDTFGVSVGAIGLALTGMWIAYALVQLPSGILGDRHGERRIVLLALGLTAAGATVTAAAPTYAAFAVAVVLLGVGAGLYYNVATALLARSFADVGSAIGIHRMGGQGAGLVAPVSATAVSVRAGWRAAVLLGAGVALVTLGGVSRVVRPAAPVRPDLSPRAAVDPRGLASLLRRPPIAYATAVATLGEFASIGTNAFLPTFLVQHHGLGLGAAGLLFSGYFGTIVVAQPLTGRVADRAGPDVALALSMTAGVVGFAGLLLGPSPVTLVPAVALAGIAMSWSPPIQARVMADLGDDERGRGFGLVRTLYILVGALGASVVGAVADVSGWPTAVGLLAGLVAVALALVGAALARRRLDPSTDKGRD